MATHPRQHPGFIRELSDGLILRRATTDDADALAALNADLHRDDGDSEPNAGVAAWTRDLTTGQHPTCKPDDFTVVEDPATGAIVSTLCLISQKWAYNGVEFSVGRPELVGTLPAYRRRGLVRAQFDTVHRWSAERGELLQAITGIPYYYRQFGYEMAVELGGGSIAYAPQIPKLKGGDAEPYRIRPARADDLPLFAELAGQVAPQYCLTCVRDAAQWRYEFGGRSPGAEGRTAMAAIDTPEGVVVGYALHSPGITWNAAVCLSDVEVLPGVPWLKVAPVVMRYIYGVARECAAKDPKGRMASISCTLPATHPLRIVIERRLVHKNDPYAWYLRLPDVGAFLRHVGPVIERRLAQSPFAGHTGTLRVSFYRTGVRLAFEEGRLIAADNYVPRHGEEDHAGFPGHTFLQLLFGYRDLDELEYAFVDAWAGDEARVLLPILFPKQPSFIWPLA